MCLFVGDVIGRGGLREYECFLCRWLGKGRDGSDWNDVWTYELQ